MVNLKLHVCFNVFQVKIDLRNQLQEGALAACLMLSINGPAPEEFPYSKALGLFLEKPRKI